MVFIPIEPRIVTSSMLWYVRKVFVGNRSNRQFRQILVGRSSNLVDGLESMSVILRQVAVSALSSGTASCLCTLALWYHVMFVDNIAFMRKSLRSRTTLSVADSDQELSSIDLRPTLEVSQCSHLMNKRFFWTTAKSETLYELEQLEQLPQFAREEDAILDLLLHRRMNDSAVAST